MPSMRLQKILSTAGVASRRAAETLMPQGRVSVNGVDRHANSARRPIPDGDDIRVDGRRVRRARSARRYILLNKPAGVVTTRRDPQGRRTVLDLLAGVREYLYPVGRLDYDSEGLLLLTNDGELAAPLTHPRHGVVKVYAADVRGVPDAGGAGSELARRRARRRAHRAGRGAPGARRSRRPARRERPCWRLAARGAQPAGAAHVRGGGPPGRAPDARRASARSPIARLKPGEWRDLTERRSGAALRGGRAGVASATLPGRSPGNGTLPAPGLARRASCGTPA